MKEGEINEPYKQNAKESVKILQKSKMDAIVTLYFQEIQFIFFF
jgi:hypothetical protein